VPYVGEDLVVEEVPGDSEGICGFGGESASVGTSRSRSVVFEGMS
jgi:hypothetical protein